MRGRNIIILFLILFPCLIHSQEKDIYRFNFGIKTGVHALTYNDPEFGIEGYDFNSSDNIQSRKIGYTVSAFVRYTFHRFYLQTEATLGLTQHNFEFTDMNGGQHALGNSTYELRTLCIQVPLLFGYNFIDQRVFGMSVFTGPRAKQLLTSHCRQEFSNFKHKGLKEVLNRTTYYWEVGLGVKIGNVFFDFTYDIGINNSSKYLESSETGDRFKSSRNENILSFSIGFIL